MSRRAALLVVGALLAGGLPAAASSGPAAGARPFRVAERPGPYAVAPTTKRLWVTAADGTRLFVEAWLPAAKGHAVPPRRVPVVVDVTPYAFEGVARPDRLSGSAPRWTQLLVSHGYALANVHLRGTGESHGCWSPHGRQDADDASRALDALSRAPFSDGRLALIGKSHDGGAAVNVAENGARQRLRGLRAVIAVSPVLSYVDNIERDGVVSQQSQERWLETDHDTSLTGRAVTQVGGDPAVQESWVEHGDKDPRLAAERAPCRVDETREIMSADGRVTPWLRERELAADTDRIRVPVLMSYGLEEIQTPEVVAAFDRIRAPKAGVFSPTDHDFPDRNRNTPSFSRSDWEAMVLAWLDRWVKGARNGADGWPVAQVQDSYGRWRAEPGFPWTGGPVGQLVLGAGDRLGTDEPTGSTTFVEAAADTVTGTGPTWQTQRLGAPLELTGQVFADLWVVVDRPQAHLQAELDELDASGNVLGSRLAVRSLQYLRPLVDGRFAQTAPVDPPVGVPVHVVLRFDPLDHVVPEGGSLSLSLGGTNGYLYAGPATGGASITVLHDCAHPSRLLFTMPRAHPDVLAVAGTVVAHGEPDDGGRLRDGDGLATQRVCGRAPRRDATLQGPVR